MGTKRSVARTLNHVIGLDVVSLGALVVVVVHVGSVRFVRMPRGFVTHELAFQILRFPPCIPSTKTALHRGLIDSDPICIVWKSKAGKTEKASNLIVRFVRVLDR